MTTLDDATTASTVSTRLVGRVARSLGRFSRRGFLVQTAVVGSALAVDAKGYVLRPQTAASTVCGPDASCSDGYTVMCCTINNGVNACPPGTFAAGWWKATDSSWCCGGYRYITDCNASCRDCTSGCSDDHICDKGCWSCSCKCGSTATCDQRRVCCNAFRYGQCNTQVKCSGGVSCRVVSCVPPYSWTNCTTTSLSDDATAEHNAPCLQGCGPILTRYDALGANGSPLGASVGGDHAVGDSRQGSYVGYQHGAISYSAATGAHAVYGYAYKRWSELGREKGGLGYPVREKVVAPDRWIQYFEHGAMADTTASTTSVVVGYAFKRWQQLGAEGGVLGYPVKDKLVASDRWIQHFEHGAMADTTASTTSIVVAPVLQRWTADGAESGRWGYPLAEAVTAADGTVSQRFEGGVLHA